MGDSKAGYEDEESEIVEAMKSKISL